MGVSQNRELILSNTHTYTHHTCMDFVHPYVDFAVLGSCFLVFCFFGSVRFYWGLQRLFFFATLPRVEMLIQAHVVYMFVPRKSKLGAAGAAACSTWLRERAGRNGFDAFITEE